MAYHVILFLEEQHSYACVLVHKNSVDVKADTYVYSMLKNIFLFSSSLNIVQCYCADGATCLFVI